MPWGLANCVVLRTVKASARNSSLDARKCRSSLIKIGRRAAGRGRKADCATGCQGRLWLRHEIARAEPARKRRIRNLTEADRIRSVSVSAAGRVPRAIVEIGYREREARVPDHQAIGLIWSDRVNTAKSVGLFLWLSLLLSFPEDRASSSRSSFERRLISLIFAGRNRIIMIRRELPLTVIASQVEPVA
jgi:hypothetical protein